MPLAIGDAFQFDGKSGAVVATTASTDSSGRGSITYGGATFRFTLFRHRRSPTPWPLDLVGDDAYCRIGLVQQTADPTLFAIAVDDPFYGRFCGGNKAHWYPASAFAATDSCIFNLGYAFGLLRVLEGGVAVADANVDFEFSWSTDSGLRKGYWQPESPDGSGAGRFVTDANGYVQDTLHSDGAIVLPRGLGAMGYRGQADSWASGPVGERVLVGLKMWYLQEYVDIPLSAGATATLNVAAVSITVTGPVGAVVGTYSDGTFARAGLATPPGSTIPAGGVQTFSGLPPGQYTVFVRHATEYDKGLPWQTVDATTSGGSYSVNFGSTWTTVPAGKMQGVIYAVGGVPAAGATISYWGDIAEPGTSEHRLITTCAADGTFGPANDGGGFLPGAAEFIIHHDQYGTFMVDATCGVGWIDGCLAGRLGGLKSGWDVMLDAEGVIAWNSHENLPTQNVWGYARDTTTGERFNFGPGTGGSTVTAPLRRGRWTYGALESTWALVKYDVYANDGTLLLADYDLNTGAAIWNSGAVEGRLFDTTGQVIACTVDGKVHGATVQASRAREVPSSDVEPWRLGLEFGKEWEAPGIEWRLDNGDEKWLALPAQVCPYDRYAVWTEPTTGALVRYHCVNCQADARFSVETPPLTTGDGWGITAALVKTSGATLTRKVNGWPRPEDYDETAGYLTTIGDLSRWKAVHITLGTLTGGVFTDGESIADAESRTGRTIGPVMLKLLLTAPYTGSGKTVTVYATDISGVTRTLTTTVLPGAASGSVWPLDWHPHDGYPKGYYTDVTGATATGDGALSCTIVNDGPGWHANTVEIPHAAYEVWACDVAYGGHDPFLRKDHIGRTWLTYIGADGAVMVRTIGPDCATISEAVNVSASAGSSAVHSKPSVCPLRNGRILILATRAGAGVCYYSALDGHSWVEGMP